MTTTETPPPVKKIEITHEHICKFYENNPSIHPENMNLIFIDMFQQLFRCCHGVATEGCNVVTTPEIKKDYIDKFTKIVQYNAFNASNDDEGGGGSFKRDDVPEHCADGWQSQPSPCSGEDDYRLRCPSSRLPPIPHSRQIQTVLNQTFPTAEIVPLQQSTMLFSNNLCKDDNMFVLKRTAPFVNVLIKSVDVEHNVNYDEMKQFVKTMEENNIHGVFLSQSSGFSSKSNYCIETYNKLIAVNVHVVKYDTEKIKYAVDIIDNLQLKLREFNVENNGVHEITMDKEVLHEINREHQGFNEQKEIALNLLKESCKKIYNQMEECKFPCLDKYLSTKFSVPVQKHGFKCDLCKLFNATNLKALAAHKRGCCRKYKTTTNVIAHVTASQPSVATP